MVRLTWYWNHCVEGCVTIWTLHGSVWSTSVWHYVLSSRDGLRGVANNLKKIMIFHTTLFPMPTTGESELSIVPQFWGIFFFMFQSSQIVGTWSPHWYSNKILHWMRIVPGTNAVQTIVTSVWFVNCCPFFHCSELIYAIILLPISLLSSLKSYAQSCFGLKFTSTSGPLNLPPSCPKKKAGQQ